ncbi:hypothetical protein [Mobilicoccus massiliensis]|uniref:hypothetical protein n=1 Tax=Mobilicoccus massiliensis TaxID=1522310 RepID=UPI000694B27F|nr:hypothetical protein [Mobilicoccus massiliensis]
MAAPDVLDELYGADLAEFVATRTRLAKDAREAGDRDLAARITALRKPTVAAWAVNRLVRERPVEIERLLDLGRRMRQAQASLDVATMQSLRRERDSTLESFTRAAGFVADAGGHGLSVSASDAVRATCVAALADEKAAEAVASGALVRTLDYAGFGEVDLDDAVAEGFIAPARRAAPAHEQQIDTTDESATAVAPGSGDAPHPPEETAPDTSTERRARDDSAARRALRRRLEEQVTLADHELARASLVVADREQKAEKAAARVDELARLLDAARDEAARKEDAAQTARDDRDAASEAYEQVRRRLGDLPTV